MYYYIDAHNKPAGPVPVDQLEYLGVSPDTYVWKPGMSQWTKAGEIDELGAIFKLTRTIPDEVIRELDRTLQQNEINNSLMKWIACALIILIVGLVVTVGVVYNNKIRKSQSEEFGTEEVDGKIEKNLEDTIYVKYKTIEIIKSN